MNPNGRPTEEPKHQTIKLRISEEMYRAIQERANREKISLSELVREIIRKSI